MNRELQFGDPVIWTEVQMRRDLTGEKRKAVEVHHHGTFRRLWDHKDGEIAVVITRAGDVVNVPAATVELDEEALTKRGARGRGLPHG